MVARDRTRSSRLVAALFGASLAACLTFTRPSSAEPAPADRETVRSLLAEGDRLAAAKDLAGALKAYTGAAAIMPVPTTIIEIGHTEEALGHLLEAREAYLRVMRLPVAPNEPAPFSNARARASEDNARVAAKIPSVRVTVSNAPPNTAPVVRIDGVPIPAEAATLPRKVNPGRHEIVASLEGFDDGRAEVDVPLEREVPVSIAIGKKTVTEAPSSPPDTATTPAPTPPLPAQASIPTWGWASLGVGAAGVMVGAVSGIVSLSRASDAGSLCDGNRCPPETRGDIDTSITTANISNVGFVVGALGLGAFVVSVVTRGHETASTPRSSLAVRPYVPGAGVGVRGTF